MVPNTITVIFVPRYASRVPTAGENRGACPRGGGLARSEHFHTVADGVETTAQ